MLTPEQVANYQSLVDRMGQDHSCMGLPYVPCDSCQAWKTLGAMYAGVITALLADRAEIAQELERIRNGVGVSSHPHCSTAHKALTALIERIK